MTKKEFVKKIIREKRDSLQEFIDILEKKKILFCVIGGIAVNAYSEPVVSLDFDVVIISRKLKELLGHLKKRKYRINEYVNSLNARSPFSDLRIQIQKDKRYQKFIHEARYKNVLGYKLPVAAIEDVLRGKIWAAEDRTRRASKRQKDLADILRLIEAKKNLKHLLPISLKRKLF